MHRSRTLALIACGAGLAPAAPAAGDVPLRDDPRARAVALSGPDVLVARTGQHGRVAVDAVARAGGAVRRLLTVPSHGRPEDAPRLAASPQRWAALVQREAPSGAVESRLYAGSPGGPASLVLRSRWASRRAWVPIDVAVDGELLLLLEVQPDGRRSRARVFTPSAEPATVPWPGDAFGAAAIAGDRIAFLGTDRRVRGRPADRLFVADWRTGAVAFPVRIGDPDDVGEAGVDLAADGSVVVAAAGRLITAAPGRAQRIVPAGGRFSAPRFAGAAGIAALRAGRFASERPLLVAPADGAQRPLGDRSTALESLAADERGVAWLANGCVRYAPLDGAPVAAPAACPAAEVVLEDAGRPLRGRSLRLVAKCVTAPPGGCRGTALLRDGRVLARGRFRVPSGTRRSIDVRFTRRGIRRVRRAQRFGGAFLELDARMRDGRLSTATVPVAVVVG